MSARVRPLNHSMSNDAGRLGQRLVETFSETTCSHRILTAPGRLHFERCNSILQDL
jgi:hypothetical protein